MGLSDLDREQLIEAYRVALVLEQRPDFKHAAVQRMRELIAERTPQRILEMEKSRGLRA